MIPTPQPEKLRVLYLTANPEATERTSVLPDGTVLNEGYWLRTDAEVRNVKKMLRSAKYRDLVEVEHLTAASMEDLLQGINDHRPHVVHFSGHGGGRGLLFDNGSAAAPEGRDMTFELLAKTLGATDTPPMLLVLNACDTLDGADIIHPSVPIVIAMADSIADAAASVFAGQFYAAIASGQSVEAALNQARVSMEMAGFVDDAALPQFSVRDGVETASTVLVKPTNSAHQNQGVSSLRSIPDMWDD